MVAGTGTACPGRRRAHLPHLARATPRAGARRRSSARRGLSARVPLDQRALRQGDPGERRARRRPPRACRADRLGHRRRRCRRTHVIRTPTPPPRVGVGLALAAPAGGGAATLPPPAPPPPPPPGGGGPPPARGEPRHAAP